LAGWLAHLVAKNPQEGLAVYIGGLAGAYCKNLSLLSSPLSPPSPILSLSPLRAALDCMVWCCRWARCQVRTVSLVHNRVRPQLFRLKARWFCDKAVDAEQKRTARGAYVLTLQAVLASFYSVSFEKLRVPQDGMTLCACGTPSSSPLKDHGKFCEVRCLAQLRRFERRFVFFWGFWVAKGRYLNWHNWRIRRAWRKHVRERRRARLCPSVRPILPISSR